jgi:microcystin degradation protein MlrC
MARIAVGGFQHETNTFAPFRATYQDFVEGGGWPALQRGLAMAEAVEGANLPIAGALARLEALGHQPVPLVWAAATPSAHVTEDAYERIVGMLVEDLRAAGSLDGVYLDLHGAMVAEHVDDGEGEVLRRVRAVIGPKIPLVASLDLHSNTTAAMVEEADALVAYRHYPHIDMAETGGRAVELLHRFLAGDGPRGKAFRQVPFIIPLTWQCTLIDPAKSIYAALGEVGAVSTSFTPGFPAADIADCGPAVFAYAATQAEADAAADRLCRLVAEAETAFAGRIWGPDEAVRHAMAKPAGKPVVIADTQDNPGGGGTSDTTGMLAALVRNGAEGAALGVMADAKAAAAAHEAGVGAEIALELGGRSGIPGDAPFHGRFTVERLGDGSFTGTGPMWGGAKCRLGPMACLRIGGVRVVVASKKLQAADQAIFRHVGIEPTEQRILVLKSSVHFRADFQPIAAEVLVAAAPGALPADPATLPFRKLRPGVRLKLLAAE